MNNEYDEVLNSGVFKSKSKSKRSSSFPSYSFVKAIGRYYAICIFSESAIVLDIRVIVQCFLSWYDNTLPFDSVDTSVVVFSFAMFAFGKTLLVESSSRMKLSLNGLVNADNVLVKE